jgi:signal transduction histidine kinase
VIRSNVVMAGSYDYRLVALSVLVAVVASYAAIDLAGRVTRTRGWTRVSWVAGGALTLGLGIWAMHFTGMLAFGLPVPIKYDWPIVLVSLAIGIGSSGVALYLMGRQTLGPVSALVGSVILGCGIAGLHYTAMVAMRYAGLCRFDLRLVTLSVMLAIVFSLIALRVAFLYREPTAGDRWPRVLGAILMGLAVSGMHYTGMAAATFVSSSVRPELSHAVSFSPVGAAEIGVITLTIQILSVAMAFADRRFAAHALELQSSEELLVRLLQSQDDERRRIARQLHETVAQTLGAIRLNLARVRRSPMAADAHLDALLAETQAMTDESLNEIRTLSYLLHPPLLEEAGLASALRWYVEGFVERSGIDVRLDIPPDLERLPDAVETAVFRIVQECLTNIHRHSGSGTARIRISTDEDGLLMEVEDKGHGMHRGLPGGTRRVGVGLAGVRERVRQLGGRLEIHSDITGTRVSVRLPPAARQGEPPSSRAAAS